MNARHAPHITAQLAAVDARLTCDRIIKLLDNANTRSQARKEIDGLIQQTGIMLDATDQMAIEALEDTELQPPLDYAIELPCPTGPIELPREAQMLGAAILFALFISAVAAAGWLLGWKL